MLGNFLDEKRKELTIILMGFPCTWNSCSHCYFHEESSTEKDVVISKNSKILKDAFNIVKSKRISTIKIFNGGSFFELPIELYQMIRKITEDRVLSVETRPELISKPIVNDLISELKPEFLNIFIGFDSFFENIRNIILNKGIPQSEIYRMSSLKIDGVNFYSYVLFGINGISEESVIISVKKFNSMFKGVTAIEFREHQGLKLKHQPSSQDLKEWLRLNTILVDFIENENEQWKIIDDKLFKNV
ncbi:MAG: hypothetical protein ACTSVY_12830 [Candidatus Helarchaeota archaeon]